jgi:hypothetical protein
MATGRIMAAEIIMDRFDNPEKYDGESWLDVAKEVENLGFQFWDIASQVCSEREVNIILRNMFDAISGDAGVE